MAILDTTNVMTGKDGCLFVEVDGVQTPILECASWSATLNVNAVDKQYVGQAQVQRIVTGYTVDLTMSETVVRDDIIMTDIVGALKTGRFPHYNFQGASFAPDGQEQRIAYNDCVPNGSFTLQNLTPGETIDRELTFSVNRPPEFISSLVADWL